MIEDRDVYFFDLQGYLLLEEALVPEDVSALNACIDSVLPLEPGEWRGYVRAHG